MEQRTHTDILSSGCTCISQYPNTDPSAEIHRSAQTTIHEVLEALPLAAKRPKREDDHLHVMPRIGIHGSLPPLPPYVFIVWYLTHEKLHIFYLHSFTTYNLVLLVRFTKY
jgi:hypothetical protein